MAWCRRRPRPRRGWLPASPASRARRQGPVRVGGEADEGGDGHVVVPVPDSEPRGGAQGEATKHEAVGRAGVQRAGAGEDQRAAGDGGLRVGAGRGGVARRRAPRPGRQRQRAGVVRGHRCRALRGVAGAAAPRRER